VPARASGDEIDLLATSVNAMLDRITELMETLRQVTGDVAHDLRTPLARLRLGLEMSKTDEATRAGMVSDIEEMDRIIGQFLDFARVESAAAGEPIDVACELAATVERYARAGHDVRFTPGTPAFVRMKPAAFSRVATNLIDNALAYGKPPVDVALQRQRDEVVLDVADRGPGIAPGDAERLKQPFTRAGEARSRADGAPGAGLGLAIVDRIARLHGGSLELRMREGGGAKARVRLPASGEP
jgi:two-component system osmolarity sensor histidine kinase EnvZ